MDIDEVLVDPKVMLAVTNDLARSAPKALGISMPLALAMEHLFSCPDGHLQAVFARGNEAREVLVVGLLTPLLAVQPCRQRTC